MDIRQAIQTRYHGPTDFKGSRITAWCSAGRTSVHYKSELNIEQNHHFAAKVLRAVLGWEGPQYKGDRMTKLQGGTLKNGDFVWVLTHE